jgi:hypothetical protein
MKSWLAVLLLVLTTSAWAQADLTPLGYVKEGVYWHRGGNFTNILQLKDGRFRKVSVLANLSSRRGPTTIGRIADTTIYTGTYTTNGAH